ncbi:MAG: hypothetical protein JWQ07_419 [Ramlibacter sp.]|nr:hypothetical protein [Ramlibacter sp.]
MPWLIDRFIPGFWLAVFVALGVTLASPMPAQPGAYPLLAFAGLLYCGAFQRESLLHLLRRHRLIFGSLLLMIAAIVVSELAALARDAGRAAAPLPAQVGLLLCLAPFAVLLQDSRRMRFVTGVFVALCLWHLVAMPVEAVSGAKVSWHGIDLLPRHLGPLNYQASGLAWQAYYFPGLFMPLFYLAAGAILERQVWGRWEFNPRTWLVASVLWLLPVACVQSRSAFAGALAATLVGLLAARKRRDARFWLAIGAVALVGVAVFWYLFSDNKSGPGLRWAYFKLFIAESLRWPWTLVGRGYTIYPDPQMQVPGLQFLQHSHNDIAQVLFTWGVPTALAYLAFWAGLLQLIYKRFWKQGEYWPALALIAAAPNMVTDLGFHHYEKAVFMVLLAGFCLAFAQIGPWRDADAEAA